MLQDFPLVILFLILADSAVPYTQDCEVVPAALLIKDVSLGSNGFHASMDEYAQACSGPPNVRYVPTFDTEKVIQDSRILLPNHDPSINTSPLS